MNEYLIRVANAEIKSKAINDFQALELLGLFKAIRQVDFYRTLEGKNMWVYNVVLNDEFQIATVERV